VETKASRQHPSCVLPIRRMDFTIALQKLASYRPHRNLTYKKTFNDGLTLLGNDGWKRRTDSKARVLQQ